MEFDAPAGKVLAAVVSDGAGSASHAEAGARAVCFAFLRAAMEHLFAGNSIEDANLDVVMEWMDSIRDRVNVVANRFKARPRDCASTIVALLAGPRSSLVVHVGDGAAVVREEGGSDWLIPSWPFHGEYASTTIFVTDDPMPTPVVVSLPMRLDRIAVFSDGIERLVLDHANRTAHAPFFEKVTAPVAASSSAGHDRRLSKSLRAYLDSQSVCGRTDDDKSLILGVRL